jgi:predicted Na+-dependent transporter
MLSTLLHFLAAHAVAALMLSVGLQTDHSVFRELARRWRLVARALAVVWIGVPVLAILVSELFALRRIGTATLLIMAISPGVPLLLPNARRAHGDYETALLVLISTAITALVLVPLWAAFLSRTTSIELPVEPIDVAVTLIPSVLIPFAAGRIITDLSPRIAAVLARIFTIVFAIGFVLLLVGLTPKAIPLLRDLTLRGVLAVIVLTLGSAAMGYAAGGPLPGARISVAFAAALGNPALAAAVAERTYPVRVVMPVIGVFLLLRALSLIPFRLWLSRHRAGAPPPPPDRDLAPARGR